VLVSGINFVRTFNLTQCIAQTHEGDILLVTTVTTLDGVGIKSGAIGMGTGRVLGYRESGSTLTDIVSHQGHVSIETPMSGSQKAATTRFKFQGRFRQGIE
jgi:hypothetical protein